MYTLTTRRLYRRASNYSSLVALNFAQSFAQDTIVSMSKKSTGNRVGAIKIFPHALSYNLSFHNTTKNVMRKKSIFFFFADGTLGKYFSITRFI